MLAPGQQATPPAPSHGAQAGTQTAATPTREGRSFAKDQSRTRTAGARAKLYLRASKLFESSNMTSAVRLYQEAAELDPGNPNYRRCGDCTQPCGHSTDSNGGQGKYAWRQIPCRTSCSRRGRGSSTRITLQSRNIWMRWQTDATPAARETALRPESGLAGTSPDALADDG